MDDLAIIVCALNDPSVGIPAETWHIEGIAREIVASDREHIRKKFHEAFTVAVGYAGFPIRVTFSDECPD